MIAVAALAFTLPAQAGINDPETIIYRASGVIDDNAGFATAFFCTNFSGVTENLRVVIRGANAAIAANVAVPLPHLNTVALATRDTQLLAAETSLATGVVNTGTVAIAATSINVTCTANLFQFFTSNPIMAPLHMTRFSPIAGTLE
jgi:hypothetical protein